MQKAVIISAPSGSGKTSIVKCLLGKEKRLQFSISATSRKKRTGEKNGADYYFITASEFKNKINSGEFVEWEEVYTGVFYGTLKSEIERIWKMNHTVIFDVDVKGGINLKKYFGEEAISLFIRVEDLHTLENRLRQRKTESEEDLKARLDKSAYEMTFQGAFDFVIVNDKLERACMEALNHVLEFLNR